MKFQITVENDTGKWTEDYDKPCDDARAEAERIIAFFNSTLRPNEMPRRLLDVKVTGESGPPDHEWDKVNLVTISDRLGMYDKMKCSRCGVTGKRFGLGPMVKRDTEFRSKKFEKCGGKPLEKKDG